MTTTRVALADMIRPNFKRMHFYKSARGEFSGRADVLLDANENPFDNGHNRYPDPMQRELRAAVAKAYNIAPESIFIGHGSSEAIDLLMRLTCRPGQDRIVQLPPTFGLYQVDADLNDLEVLSIPLDDEMQPDVQQVLAKAEPNRDRILFLCTPNNPVGNDYERERVMQLIEHFPGLVVVDQAYVEFSSVAPYRELIDEYPHVIVMETMSKAFGLAGARLGFAFGHPELIGWLNNIKPPYNTTAHSAATATEAFAQLADRVQQDIDVILAERQRVLATFAEQRYFTRVYPTDANFVLVAHPDADRLYQALVNAGIVVRNQTAKFGSGHLRISIGTPAENDRLLQALASF